MMKTKKLFCTLIVLFIVLFLNTAVYVQAGTEIYESTEKQNAQLEKILFIGD